jgi:hypothetical protein
MEVEPTNAVRDGPTAGRGRCVVAPAGSYRGDDYDPLAGKKEVTAWGGYILFAAGIMILIGIFTALMGSIALFDQSWFSSPPSSLLAFSSYHTWGVIHLVVGLFAIVAGIGVMTGRTWARIMAIIVVGVNAISQVAFTSAYPAWSIIVLALDIIAIYALTVHGGDLAND